ncbi:lysophospholipase [Dichomitus squalens]|uniref:Lysophospholipase n=1 Tax=Dichomitus squalens TaxID=114155 RepID=A0A4Q9MK12_9APHY|nr:lysophospholipase [Dichomitus squalens]
MATSTSESSTFTEEWLLGPEDTHFYTRTYTASSPRAVVLFIHGFAEYVGRYEWAHGIYSSRGITVFAFDQRGFGRTGMDEENRSPGSTYCKTTFREQFADIDWALKLVHKRFPKLPIFLMGHSMGGGLSLGFPTRTSPPPTQESISLLSGVVATSPLLVQPSPVPRPVRFVARMVGKLFPLMLVAAPVNSDALTHDRMVNEAAEKDPMCPKTVSLKALDEVLGGCEQVLRKDYTHWPKNLPLLLVHGTADKMTSYAASQEFFAKVDAQDKESKAFEDGYHELVHEPDGVKEKFVDECITWILAHSKHT